jgi:hypothetical protein
LIGLSAWFVFLAGFMCGVLLEGWSARRRASRDAREGTNFPLCLVTQVEAPHEFDAVARGREALGRLDDSREGPIETLRSGEVEILPDARDDEPTTPFQIHTGRFVKKSA